MKLLKAPVTCLDSLVLSTGGLTLLALLSLIMDAFRIGYYVGYRSCLSAVLGVYPVIHATHTVAQVSPRPNFHFGAAIIFQQRRARCLFPVNSLNQIGLRRMSPLLAR